MSVQINGYNIIDNSRNVTTTTKVTSSTCNVPVGTTPARPGSPATGSIRYNTTDSVIEYYNGSIWIALKSYTALSFAARGVFGHGSTAPAGAITNNMQYITISSTSNTTPFGSLSYSGTESASCSSTTRGVFSGGQTPAFTNAIVYITIASTGNSTPFGNLNNNRSNHFGTSNATIGLFGGGLASPSGAATQDVQKITIATTGNSTPFSSLVTTNYDVGAMSTPTTAYITGGTNEVTIMRYTSYPSGGTWSFFGSLNAPAGRQRHVSANSSIRGLNMSGLQLPSTLTSTIDYMTFSTLSNTSLWGTITTARSFSATVYTPTRAVIAGGNNNSTIRYSTMEYIDNYNSRGSGSPFGSLSTGLSNHTGLSNGHAGLGY